MSIKDIRKVNKKPKIKKKTNKKFGAPPLAKLGRMNFSPSELKARYGVETRQEAIKKIKNEIENQKALIKKEMMKKQKELEKLLKAKVLK